MTTKNFFTAAFLKQLVVDIETFGGIDTFRGNSQAAAQLCDRFPDRFPPRSDISARA